MEEQLVSKKVAKLAKEKGFKEYCVTAYFKGEEVCLSHCYSLKDDEYRPEDEVYAPTQSLLQKWLREEHKLFIEVIVLNIYHKFKADIADENVDIYFVPNEDGEYEFNSYEEALEAALLYALNKINS